MHMRRKLLIAIVAMWSFIASSQSKVFKEVSEDISTEMKIITQDDALIGYLVFTQLEKATKDSFNYQVSIMDENLNDIGKLEFREKNLELKSVAFDQDILCLVYLKSDLADLKSVSNRQIRNSVDGGRNYVFVQMINLEGDIINTSSHKVDLILRDEVAIARTIKPSMIAGRLKHDVVLKNIPNKGFALLYGDDNKTQLSAINIDGKESWKKTVAEATGYGMLTTPSDIFILSKKNHDMVEGGYEISGFSVADGKASPRLELKDKQNNQLKVLSFTNDLSTGKPIVSGLIINSQRGNRYNTIKGLHKGPYSGVFSMVLDGTRKSEYKERYSYWSDGSKQPEIATNGMRVEGKLYPRFLGSIRDFNGNTYFIGTSYIRKTRVGGIAASILTAPLIAPPIMLMIPGTHKSRQSDVVILKQDSIGNIRFDQVIDASESKYLASIVDVHTYPRRQFYSVTNSATKSNFIIVDEAAGAKIYNVQNQKIMREVPHREGSTTTYIYPAKEGHIMVMEYNKKAKETRLSIEAL